MDHDGVDFQNIHRGELCDHTSGTRRRRAGRDSLAGAGRPAIAALAGVTHAHHPDAHGAGLDSRQTHPEGYKNPKDDYKYLLVPPVSHNKRQHDGISWPNQATSA